MQKEIRKSRPSTGSLMPSVDFPREEPSFQPIFESILKPLFSDEIALKKKGKSLGFYSPHRKTAKWECRISRLFCDAIVNLPMHGRGGSVRCSERVVHGATRFAPITRPVTVLLRACAKALRVRIVLKTHSKCSEDNRWSKQFTSSLLTFGPNLHADGVWRFSGTSAVNDFKFLITNLIG